MLFHRKFDRRHIESQDSLEYSSEIIIAIRLTRNDNEIDIATIM